MAALLALAVCSSPAEAAKPREAPDIDAKIGQKLNKAVESLNAEKYEEARTILQGLQEKRLSPYEKARVENILAAVAQAQGRYGAARGHLQAAIASGGLNDQEMSSSRFQIAQLFLAEEKWKEGAEVLKAWFATATAPNAYAYYLLAIAHYQLKQFDLAVEPAQKAVDLSDKPQEGWMQLLVSLRLERQEYSLALPVLHRLVAMSPGKKVGWLQLSSVYGAMEKYSEALAPMQVAYEAGLLTEEVEYRRLTDLLFQANIPYRAAQILTKLLAEKKLPGEARDWERLGNAWVAARHFDKAVGPLAKAASMSNDGNLYLRLAEIHVQLEDWPKAVDALQRAFDKGSLKNAGDAQMLMGISLYSQKRFRDARVYFERATQTPKHKSQAEGWMKYIDQELAKQ